MNIKAMCVGVTAMDNGSLESVIADIIRRLDGVHAGQGDHAGHADPLRQLEAFMPVDPVLARLHKDYLDANRNHKKLAETHGMNDPMTEIAADLLDSARSALQTRLIELQESRAREVNEALGRRLRSRRAEQEAAQARAAIARREQDRESDGFFWFVVMYYWLMQQTFITTRKRLSAANDFALATVQERRTLYA